MSNYDGPPPPPGQDKPSWWQQTRFAVPLAIVGTLLLAFLIFGGGSDTQPQEAVVDNSTEQVEPESAPEPEPEPEPEHDWASEQAYAEDMVDSTDKTSDLLFEWSFAMEDYARGYISDAEFINLNNTFREVLNTHREHFRGTTPPPGYERSHEGIQESWDLLDEAAALMDSGVRTQSLGDVDRAMQLIEEAERVIIEASRNLPAGHAERT